MPRALLGHWRYPGELTVSNPAMNSEDKMQKYSLHWTSLTVAVAALIGLMSAAQASSVCYNQNAPDFSSAGTVCVDVQPRAFSSAAGGYVGPTLTGASPQSSG